MSVTSPALRYHGAKFRLAPWVISHFPAHTRYVEPFGGAAGVLLNKPRSYAEVYNDLDGDIVTFFRVLRDKQMSARLEELLVLTPYAEAEFHGAFEEASDSVERARRTAIRAAMGFGSGGATKNNTGFRRDTEREGGVAAHIWAKYPNTLRAICQRFAGVHIEQQDAIQCMRMHDSPLTLHYVDPPYMPETRNSGRVYRHEMTIEQHEVLLQAVKGLAGMVIVSGYRSDLYADALHGWQRVETKARISAARGTGLRVEVLWLNPACQAARSKIQQVLFDNATSHPNFAASTAASSR